MNKKIIGVIFAVVIIILGFLMLTSFNIPDQDILKQTFVIDAVYFESDGYAEISFYDKSNKTTYVILEILGMPKSYQKTFNTTSFIDTVAIDSVPLYGWKSMPVTFVVEHEDFGLIGIKTEIHSQNDPKKNVIFSKL
jgi:hypothetical protein